MSNNDITGDRLVSRSNTKAFEENFDLIFRNKKMFNQTNIESCGDNSCPYCKPVKCPDHGKSLIDYSGE